jgi:ParB-like chromosome segregation protein Spo0J
MAKLKTPYADLLPPLSTEEHAALKADIKANGVRVPIDVDEDGNILDGHHRYAIEQGAPTHVVKGLSPAEKKAHVYRSNFLRRNMSLDRRNKIKANMKQVAFDLREEDAKKYTQQVVADTLGVSQPTVAGWFAPNIKANKRCNRPDARVKVPKEQRAPIYERLQNGDTQVQVAADWDVSHTQIQRIEKAEAKRREKECQEEDNLKLARKETADNDQHVILGDFREHADDIADESVSLIFTDPPYDRKSLDLYGDLAEFGARKLKPGGSLLCYVGHYALPDVLPLMAPHLRFWWECCCQHTGKSARMTEYGIVVGWKPILWFVKETRGDKGTFVDDIVVSEMEKGTHAWQQGLVDAAYYLGKLSRPGDLIVDPFCGGGTTAVAAKRLERRWRTFEIKEQAAVKARKRIRDTAV